jgi:O-antigen chain-terminating methyltransferase
MPSQLDYYEFMGYSRDVLLDRYEPYAARFEPGQRVLDVGSGRGEFLELLARRGVTGVGVDADGDMVQLTRDRGFEVEQGAAPGYLLEHPAQFDGIFVAHLIEHLPAESVRALVAAAAAALRAGGRLLLVTPSPHNLSMHTHEFWTDLQHVRFYTPEIVRWILHENGFHDIEVGENTRYRSGPAFSNNELAPPPPAAADQEPPPHPGLPARALGRLKRMVIPAPLLERIQRIETEAGAHRARVDWLEQELTSTHQWVAQLRGDIEGFFPPAEFFVTGIR